MDKHSAFYKHVFVLIWFDFDYQFKHIRLDFLSFCMICCCKERKERNKSTKYLHKNTKYNAKLLVVQINLPQGYTTHSGNMTKILFSFRVRCNICTVYFSLFGWIWKDNLCEIEVERCSLKIENNERVHHTHIDTHSGSVFGWWIFEYIYM